MNDTNIGPSFVYDSPEDKEISRLETVIESQRQEIEKLNGWLETATGERSEFENQRKEIERLKAAAIETRSEFDDESIEHNKQIDRLTRENDQLRAENAELRKDKSLVDWFENPDNWEFDPSSRVYFTEIESPEAGLSIRGQFERISQQIDEARG
jgi:hypothetical protein